jgi:hypothetical protein
VDVEKTIEFILQAQAETEARLQRFADRTEAQQLQLAENLTRVVDVIAQIAETQRRNAEETQRLREEFRRHQEETRRYQDETRRAHERFDALHQETDERLHALIKMMDEWIRKGGAQNGAS